MLFYCALIFGLFYVLPIILTIIFGVITNKIKDSDTLPIVYEDLVPTIYVPFVNIILCVVGGFWIANLLMTRFLKKVL